MLASLTKSQLSSGGGGGGGGRNIPFATFSMYSRRFAVQVVRIGLDPNDNCSGSTLTPPLTPIFRVPKTCLCVGKNESVNNRRGGKRFGGG